MSRLILSSKIIVGDSPIHGRGVFAVEDIEAGEILEECHFYLLSQRDFSRIDDTEKHMALAWPMHEPDHQFAIVLGTGTIYNHSDDNNATWLTDTERNCFRFFSTRKILAGEEICTNYMRRGGVSFG
jgi:SET domain-containing protein